MTSAIFRSRSFLPIFFFYCYFRAAPSLTNLFISRYEAFNLALFMLSCYNNRIIFLPFMSPRIAGNQLPPPLSPPSLPHLPSLSTSRTGISTIWGPALRGVYPPIFPWCVSKPVSCHLFPMFLPYAQTDVFLSA